MKEANFLRSVKEVKFGAWSLNPKLQIISDGEVERELEPLLFKILCYLIINKDEIITRQDLIDDVWCQHYVDDNAINRAMSELRKVLKSEIQRGLVVKTHYRKGYSFFLDPEIIHHEEKNLEITSNKIIEKSNKTKKKALLVIGMMLFAIFSSSLYIYYSFYSQVKDEKINVVTKKYKEETLSWLQGVYSQMVLSPDNTTVALAFTEKDQNYSSLLLKNLSTGEERKITEKNANIYPAGWSSNSDRVIYRLQKEDICQLWDVGLNPKSNSNYLFDCQSQPVIAVNTDKDIYIYSKYGYRGRGELSVLVNRNQSTGAEFQISSPNLNSYGDKFLYFIKSKNKVVFERRQLSSSELYITDLEGGDQVKLYETKNRIWTINYDQNTDSLLWFDNLDSIFYQYSLKNDRIVKETVLEGSNYYSVTYPISLKQILGLIYPFAHNTYSLDLTSQKIYQVSSRASKFGHMSGDDILYISKNSETGNLNIYKQDKIFSSKIINTDYKDLIVSPDSEEALGVKYNEIEILNYNDLSIKKVIKMDDSLLSVEYLNNGNIGYVVQGKDSTSNLSYIYNNRNSKSVLLPIENAVWFNQLTNSKLLFLNNLDELLLFDLSSGVEKTGCKVNGAAYKHSFSLEENMLYHSNGKSIYKYNFSAGACMVPQEVYEIDDVYAISEINYSSANNVLILDMIKITENELVRLTLEGGNL